MKTPSVVKEALRGAAVGVGVFIGAGLLFMMLVGPVLFMSKVLGWSDSAVTAVYVPWFVALFGAAWGVVNYLVSRDD